MGETASEALASKGLANPARLRSGRARTIAAITAAAVVLLAAGSVLAVTTIHSGMFNGAGVYDTGSPLTWWTQTVTGTAKVPSPAPSSASANASEPTVLGSVAAGLGLNGQTAGQEAVAWTFTELAGAPASTEVEIVFEVVSGASSTLFTAFVETQATSPTTSLTFTFYVDAGTQAIVLTDWLQISEACGSVGACP